MSSSDEKSPDLYQGVMISGTFGDLTEHRNILREALERQELVPVDMQNYVVDPVDDIISSSLEMVVKGSAYIGLISHRYGHVPDDARNPTKISISQMEFQEAQELGRPTLIFIMGNEHRVKPTEIEIDPENRRKLEDFRTHAKKGRIYVTFQDKDEFRREALLAVAKLKKHLEKQAADFVGPIQPIAEPVKAETKNESYKIPSPPDFYAEPPYLGSHKFVGRQAELDSLDDWASPSDTHTMLLFEAIGGTGKSMLTWHWANHHATKIRDDWAGHFWYSFYEKGARLESFCRHALAYMMKQPLESFEKKKTPELGELLLAELQSRPWLIVMDGLERILVTYNRSDASELSDEAAENPEDKIADRDPLAAIRPEDEELLKALSSASKSKLLISSRLIPRALINSANSAIPGVLHERLLGLRPADAETLLRSDSCKNISGDSGRIRSFLQEHCGCHPLVIGVLAGLINQPAPWRGDFDAWEKAPDGGGKLNLADLNLIQKRNHILESALAVLPEKSRAMLSTLTLLSEAADAELLLALNPHTEETDAGQLLWDTVADLEARGFLQYDGGQKHYDLHPVVRGIVAGGMRPEETETYGERVVDHFSSQTHDPWDEAETLDDVRDGLQIVRTLLRMGRRQAACNAWREGLSTALLFNLEAHAEILALVADLFPENWDRLPEGLEMDDGSYFANSAAIALDAIGHCDASLAAFGTMIQENLKHENWTALPTLMSNIATSLSNQDRLAAEHRFRRFTLDLLEQLNSGEGSLFVTRLDLFRSLTRVGDWTTAQALWKELDPIGRPWSRKAYRPGRAEYCYAELSFQHENLTEEILKKAERLASKGKNRQSLRNLHSLRGEWLLERGKPDLAAKNFEEAVRMARESSLSRNALASETWLALAQVRAGHFIGTDACKEADRLTKVAEGSANRPLALLYIELGDKDEFHKVTKHHALAAYKWAWADGEPYVRRYELDQTKKILVQLNEPYPDLPPYDPEKDMKFDWEDDVRAAIEKLKTEREERQKNPAEE